MFKRLPTNEKVFSADGNSLGTIIEVHVKFKLGNVEFNNVFIILNHLQCDTILVYHGNVIIQLVAHGIERVSISLLLKTNFWL